MGNCIIEFFGTLGLFGDGVCCACSLKKSKAFGCHLNPAVTLGLAMASCYN